MDRFEKGLLFGQQVPAKTRLHVHDQVLQPQQLLENFRAMELPLMLNPPLFEEEGMAEEGDGQGGRHDEEESDEPTAYTHRCVRRSPIYSTIRTQRILAPPTLRKNLIHCHDGEALREVYSTGWEEACSS